MPPVHLVEILLPLRDPGGKPFDTALFARIKAEMIDRFGGITAFTRSPAEGVWESEGGRERDEIVVLQIMTEMLDRAWWGDYRRGLEQLLSQDEIVIRASRMEKL